MPPSSVTSDTDDASGMDDLISLINRLQDVVTASNLPPEFLDLPQMAVVGEQSAGKSSVLENIVGKDFLPRGTGIVTRCPLVLQLVHSSDQDYAEFLHLEGKKFTDYGDVKREILAQTEKQAGRSKGISDKPINLKIYSPNVPHLTLVDLPGLTKNPVGDQPGNIEEIIRKLILKYIKQENTLILAVTSATHDLVCSDSLKLAESVDPQRLRTIGIITKIDMMDNGTDARQVLLNKVISLKRGYIGLVNRSQEDIDKNHTILMAQMKEKRFFKSQKAYRDIADRMGAKYLQARLSEQLCQHIKEKLPTMRAQVRKENQRVKRSLDAMNAFEQNTDDTWLQPKIVEVVQKFIDEVHKQMEGQSAHVDSKTLSGGAQLNDCYYTKIYPLLNQVIFFDKKEVYTLWKNMSGYQNMMFFTQQAFNNITKKYLLQYKEPLETSTTLSAEIVKSSIDNCMYLFDAYPYLKQEITRLVGEELSKNEETTKQQLCFHLKAQKSFMNIYHPDFMKQDEIGLNNCDVEQNGEEKLHRGDSNTSLNESEMSYPIEDVFNKRNEIMRGDITIHSAIPPTRSYYFIMTFEKLAWFKNEYDTRPKQIVSVVGLVLEQFLGKPGPKRYHLFKQGTRRNDNMKIQISFRNSTDEEKWLDAFNRVGVDITFDTNAQPPDNKSTWHQNAETETPAETVEITEVTTKIEGDPRHDFTDDPVLNEVMQKLKSYSMIIDETIHDISPKYISYFLVAKTLKYVKRKMLSDVQKEDPTSLMRVSDEQLSKREEYFRVFNATESALKMMGEVSGTGKQVNNKNEKNTKSSEDNKNKRNARSYEDEDTE